MYLGATQDMKHRLEQHNKGFVPATRCRKPLKLVYYEAFLSKKDAFAREQWLKTGWEQNHLRKILSDYLKNLGG